MTPSGEAVVLSPIGHVESPLTVRPRDDPSRPLRGVFGTRSPDRPNPIGLHRVAVAEIEPGRLRVRDLEALHGTPILDIKPVLSDQIDER